MKTAISILTTLFSLVVFFGVGAWIMWRVLKRSDDPAKLVFKWVLTGVVTIVFVGTMVGIGRSPALPPIAAVFGLIYSFIWAPSLGGWFASFFTGFYDGGSAEPEYVPLYSIAEAKRKRGKPVEALAEIKKQLALFPNDFQGWMMLAETLAEDMQDVNGAVQTVDDHILTLEGLGPRNVSFALNRCADWELKLRRDSAAAIRALERVVELLPDTEQAQLALQRIAHVTNATVAPGRRETTSVALPHFDNRIGLRQKEEIPPEEKPREDVAQIAQQYLLRLQEMPQDNEAREKLAVLYAEDYQRLELAEQELEQLITAENQPAKQVIHWLNLLADLQVKHGDDPERARQTLRRITELFPKSAHAEKALSRIAHLNLHARGKQKGQVIKLGTYEIHAHGMLRPLLAFKTTHLAKNEGHIRRLQILSKPRDQITQGLLIQL